MIAQSPLPNIAYYTNYWMFINKAEKYPFALILQKPVDMYNSKP